MSVRLLAPAGFDERASGGNVYDRHLRDGLRDLGWDLAVDEVASAGEVAEVLSALPVGSVVLVDSLVASWGIEALLASSARLVPLLHMTLPESVEGALLARAAAVVTTSEWARRRLVERYPLDPGLVHAAVPGVESADPAPGTASGGELLCVASLIPAKGHEVLLDALGRLLDLDWRCTLAGPADRDPDFAGGLHKVAADTGLADRLVFAGELSPDELAARYAGADVLVLPSLAETYGMVVAEALSHGLPVIASAVGGVPEALGTLAHGVPGELVTPGDPGALAGALRTWLGEPGYRRSLREAALARRPGLPSWALTAARVAVALEAAR